MDRKLKAKWVVALRSGEYKQARGMLKSDDAYCCLGVLSKQLGLLEEDGYALGSDYYLRTVFYLDLARMNDNGYTFQQIADLLVERKAVFLIPEVLPPVA